MLTRYNNKNCVIDGIDWGASPDNVFKKRDGTEVTIRQYYKVWLFSDCRFNVHALNNMAGKETFDTS